MSINTQIDTSEFDRRHIQARLEYLLNEIHQTLGIKEKVEVLSNIRLDRLDDEIYELRYELICKRRR